MFKRDVIHYFGRQRSVAETLKISQAAISKWGPIIPEKQALRLEYLTQGHLVYNPHLYRKLPYESLGVNV